MADPDDFQHGSTRYNDLAVAYRLPLTSNPTANQTVQFWKTGAVFTPNCLIEMTSSGAQPASANSPAVIGVNREPRTFQANPTTGIYGIAMVVGYGRASVISDLPFNQGANLKAANGGNATALIVAASGGNAANPAAGSTIGTSSAGGNFANQPLNDSVQVLSSSAADTTQIVTLYGTTTGTNTVVKQTVALNGTTAVTSAKVNWGQILGVTLSASCAGTVTIRKTTGPATIITLATTVLSAGLVAVTAPGAAYNGIPAVVAGGASTKQFGVIGTTAAGAQQLDSVALNGATSVPLNLSFQTIQFLLVGDNATATTTTLSVGPADSAAASIGVALEAAPSAGFLTDAYIY
jgi:hypothetical protein